MQRDDQRNAQTLCNRESGRSVDGEVCVDQCRLQLLQPTVEVRCHARSPEDTATKLAPEAGRIIQQYGLCWQTKTIGRCVDTCETRLKEVQRGSLRKHKRLARGKQLIAKDQDLRFRVTGYWEHESFVVLPSVN